MIFEFAKKFVKTKLYCSRFLKNISKKFEFQFYFKYIEVLQAHRNLNYKETLEINEKKYFDEGDDTKSCLKEPTTSTISAK